jgi:hypothetical protein
LHNVGAARRIRRVGHSPSGIALAHFPAQRSRVATSTRTPPGGTIIRPSSRPSEPRPRPPPAPGRAPARSCLQARSRSPNALTLPASGTHPRRTHRLRPGRTPTPHHGSPPIVPSGLDDASRTAVAALRNREPARIRLRNDPRLGLARPAPPPAHASDHLDPPNVASRAVKRMVAHMVKPIPQKESTPSRILHAIPMWGRNHAYLVSALFVGAADCVQGLPAGTAVGGAYVRAIDMAGMEKQRS